MYWSMSLNPPLTAVGQPGFEIGRMAIDLLYQRIADPNRSKVNVNLKTELIVRKSCENSQKKNKILVFKSHTSF